MNNESIYIYDIIRHFGAEGLKTLLAHFFKEREEAGDFTNAELCLEDVLLNTRLLTHSEYDYEFGHESKAHDILLQDSVYIVLEDFHND